MMLIHRVAAARIPLQKGESDAVDGGKVGPASAHFLKARAMRARKQLSLLWLGLFVVKDILLVPLEESGQTAGQQE
jgi:hypothetical protein